MYDMTEYEELMFFDLEDLGDDFPKNENVQIHPTWQSLNNKPSVAVSGRTRRAMSATAVQTLGESVSPRGSNMSLGYNCQCGDENSIRRMATPEYPEAMITLEDIRAELNSCFTCGVSWSQEHVSLDCSECGGYSLKRPCPLCDGRCHTAWKRDVTMSHESGKARWTGECGLSCGPSLEESLVPTLEKLRATS